MDLSVLDISYKWNQTVQAFTSFVAAFTQHNAFKLHHLVTCISASFLVLLVIVLVAYFVYPFICWTFRIGFVLFCFILAWPHM